MLLFSIPFVRIAWLTMLTFLLCVCLFYILSEWMPIIFDLFRSFSDIQSGFCSKRINIYPFIMHLVFSQHFRFVQSFFVLLWFIFSPPSLPFTYSFYLFEKWLKCNLYLSLSWMDQLSVQVQHFRRKMGTNCKTNEIFTTDNGRTQVW